MQRWALERVGHGKLLLCCRVLGGARRFGAHGGEGWGHIVAAAHLQLVVECTDFNDTRNKYSVASSMEELFRTVDVRNVLDFIKETNFYKL